MKILERVWSALACVSIAGLVLVLIGLCVAIPLVVIVVILKVVL